MLFQLVKAQNKSCDEYSARSNFSEALKDKKIKYLNKNGELLPPVKDQDSIGYCYAYSGSDVLENWLKRTKQMPKEKSLSSLAMGLNYDKDNWVASSGDFHALAIKRKLLQPEIQRAREKAIDLFNKQVEYGQKMRSLRSNYISKHPLYKDLLMLEKKIDEQKQNIGLEKSTESESSKKLQTSISLDEKYYKLTDKIEKETESNPEFIKLNSPLQEKYKSLDDENYHYYKIARDLETMLNPGKDSVPQGGKMHDAIEKNLQQICYETEVSSRDTALSLVYEKYRDLIGETNYQPNNIEGALGYIMLNRYEQSDESNCISFEITKALFPGFQLANATELAQVISKMNITGNMFDELLKLSCAKKKLNIKPNIKTSKIDSTLPLEDNSAVIKHIDDAINSGNVISVAYRSQLLDREDLQDETSDYHASTIIGNINVCGEPYYILRNSWGKEACQKNAKEFIPSADKANLANSYTFQQGMCKSLANDNHDEMLLQCKDDACIVKAHAKLSMDLNNCSRKFEIEVAKATSHPYFCDDDGNYLIKKTYLTKGIYEATSITN